jgi:hypothetical protein
VPDGVAATAVRLTRDALTGRDGTVTTAVDVAIAEPPLPLGPDQWLVRVQAVVLRGDTRRWRSATHETWAVPVGVRHEAHVGLEAPWRVALEEPVVTRPDWQAATVDERAVRSALRTVGARGAPDLAAQQHPALPHVIRVRIAGPEPAGHIWLTTEPTERVLGASVTADATGQVRQ